MAVGALYCPHYCVEYGGVAVVALYCPHYCVEYGGGGSSGFILCSLCVPIFLALVPWHGPLISCRTSFHGQRTMTDQLRHAENPSSNGYLRMSHATSGNSAYNYDDCHVWGP